MGEQEKKQVMQNFRTRQNRQIIAIAIALFLVLLSAVLYKRPVFFGELPKAALFGGQVAVIAGFLAFTAYNWRCPSCGGYLGTDIHRRACKKCGTRLR